MIDDAQAGRILSAMVEISRTFTQADRHSRSSGLTGTAFAVLQHLRSGDLRITGLAEHLRLSASVTSRAVASLEERGLVQRGPDPHDARAHRLYLTPQGSEYLAERERAAVGLFAEQLRDWTATDAADATRTLDALRVSLTNVFAALENGQAAAAHDSGNLA